MISQFSKELLNLYYQNKGLISHQLEQNKFMKYLEEEDKEQITQYMFKNRIKKLSTYIKLCEYKGWTYGKITQQLQEMQAQKDETNIVLISFKNKLSSKGKKQQKTVQKLHQKYLDEELRKQQELELYQAKYQKDLEEREAFEQLTKSFLKKMKIDQVIQEVKATENIKNLVKVEEGKDSSETQIECIEPIKEYTKQTQNNKDSLIKSLKQKLIEERLECFIVFYKDESDAFLKIQNKR